ncbi:MAG TPA: class I lanthipeptide [Thermoanaerobaculia bacterium]|jgi:hypothetical protein|nr:class I lanthipeptide [Thermoanaerobaculia bacterium]
MKKQMKKLVLAKETLRSLGVKSLEQVAGGSALPMFACASETCASCRYCVDEPIGP